MNYENRIIAFIDILGFRDHVGQSLTENGLDLSEKISDLREILDIAQKMLIDKPNEIPEKGDPFGYRRNVTHFSDTIVASFPQTEILKLPFILLDFQHFLCNLLRRGFVCRGSIVYGKLIHEEKTLFGPGLIQAYDLERKNAKYPRIIIDKSIIGIYNLNKGLSKNRKKLLPEFGGLIARDNDKKYFLDYFNTDIFDNQKYCLELRTLIQSGLQHSNQKIRDKYLWMSNHSQRLEKRLLDRGLPIKSIHENMP